MALFKDFLLQLSLVFAPFGIYLAYFSGHIRKRKYMNLLLGALWGISILLCISFPVRYGPGMTNDLRIVPLLIGTLYGGRKTGLFLGALIILYRLYLIGWNASFFITFSAILCGFSVILYFQKAFERSSRGKRIELAVLLSVFYSLSGSLLAGLFRGISAESVTVHFVHLITTAVLVWLMIHLIENMTEIHAMRLELHKAERLRVTGDLAGIFAHEIRNPMQVARGFLQLLDTPDLTAAKKEYIRLSIEELDRANEIIREFLLLGKPAEEKMEEVDAGRQVERSAHLIRNYALSKNVFIETRIAEGCRIWGNEQRLNQFMINILKNAIEAMPDGGTLLASCTPAGEAYVEIRIKDEGVGMSKEELERLGSPYYSLKENGTGLGMLVSFQIIRSFGGKLQVVSEIDSGTEVIAKIPSLERMTSAG